jgi:hypothetical protein
VKRVRTPDGDLWSVYVDATGPRLRWRPLRWWRARHDAKRNQRPNPRRDTDKERWWESLDPFLELEAALLVVALVVVVMSVAMILGFIVVPLLVQIIDGILFVVGGVALFVWRTVTRSGWTVVAGHDGKGERRWRTDGWWAARRTQQQIARSLSTGTPVVTPDATEMLNDRTAD